MSPIGRPARLLRALPAGAPALRLGLRYVRGLRESAARAMVHQRNLAPFTSIDDLVHRVPELRKDQLQTLAEIGALNSVGQLPQNLKPKFQIEDLGLQIESPLVNQSEIYNLKSNIAFHRRDALWQIERSVRRSGPLLDELSEPDSKSPLRAMNPEERLVADFHGTGLTVGPHPMAYHRARMDAIGVRKASDLAGIPDGQYLRIGGCVIARQRPGTAKGFVFLSLEDETGVADAIIMPDLFPEKPAAGDFGAVSDGGRDSAKSGQRGFGEGAEGNASVGYPGGDQFARFLLGDENH